MNGRKVEREKTDNEVEKFNTTIETIHRSKILIYSKVSRNIRRIKWYNQS